MTSQTIKRKQFAASTQAALTHTSCPIPNALVVCQTW